MGTLAYKQNEIAQLFAWRFGRQEGALRRPIFVALAALVALIGFWVWWHYRVPAGVEPMGEQSERMALIGLWTGVVALLTSIIGLVTRIVELAKAGR